jgi:glycerol-3-phosphate O-acyltransferase
LRAKESLHNAVHAASKEQREFGQKVVQIGGSLGVKYVLNKHVSTKDIFDVVKNPKSSADQAKKDVLKVAMEKLKSKQLKS